MPKEARRQFTNRTGTQKSYISGIENGHTDILLATLRRIVTQGLGRRVSLSIE